MKHILFVNVFFEGTKPATEKKTQENQTGNQKPDTSPNYIIFLSNNRAESIF